MAAKPTVHPLFTTTYSEHPVPNDLVELNSRLSYRFIFDA